MASAGCRLGISSPPDQNFYQVALMFKYHLDISGLHACKVPQINSVY